MSTKRLPKRVNTFRLTRQQENLIKASSIVNEITKTKVIEVALNKYFNVK
jgi:hypothetical protein